MQINLFQIRHDRRRRFPGVDWSTCRRPPSGISRRFHRSQVRAAPPRRHAVAAAAPTVRTTRAAAAGRAQHRRNPVLPVPPRTKTQAGATRGDNPRRTIASTTNTSKRNSLAKTTTARNRIIVRNLTKVKTRPKILAARSPRKRSVTVSLNGRVRTGRNVIVIKVLLTVIRELRRVIRRVKRPQRAALLTPEREPRKVIIPVAAAERRLAVERTMAAVAVEAPPSPHNPQGSAAVVGVSPVIDLHEYPAPTVSPVQLRLGRGAPRQLWWIEVSRVRRTTATGADLAPPRTVPVGPTSPLQLHQAHRKVHTRSAR